MAGSDADDDFSDLYKEYTGPVSSIAVQKGTETKKRSQAGSDDEEGERRDPNAVPTDFTSREAKVWEAKSKAIERNWKKRKEEEMICKICGEPGHFTQGCPSTLGANRKLQDFFERVPAREKHVKALFTDKVINGIEKDIGCKIKMEEKFIIVSGKDRLILSKGVDAVHKVIKEGGDQKSSGSFQMSKSRSPDQIPSERSRQSEPQRSNPRDPPQLQHKPVRRDKVVEDHVREDLRKLPSHSPQAYGNNGARSRSRNSRSPAHPHNSGSSYTSDDGRNQSVERFNTDGWDIERRISNLHSRQPIQFLGIPQNLEELELEYKHKAAELEKIRDKEEDEENKKHRETIRDMRENYMSKVNSLREIHAKQWEEFLQHDAQRRQQEAAESHMFPPGFAGYNRPHGYSDYENTLSKHHYTGANFPADGRDKYSISADNNYPSRLRDSYSEFQQRPRGEEFGKAYNNRY